MNILDLPTWLNGIVIVGGSALLGVALVYGLDVFVNRRGGKEGSSVFSDGLQTTGTLYAVVAGFLIFGMYTTFDVSSQQSADEASALVLMYRSAQAFPQPQRDQAQQAVVGYINSVITDEWPALSDRVDSPKTSKALDNLFNVYGPMEPDGRWSDQYTKSIDHLDTVAKLRFERVDQSRNSSLPTIYWFLLFAGGFIMILYLSLAQVENKPMHALAVGLTATMIGLVIFLLIEMNYPFQGDIALSPEHFRNALTYISQMGSG